jgi:hypothetical protein
MSIRIEIPVRDISLIVKNPVAAPLIQTSGP